MCDRTWQVPWVEAVQVYVANGGRGEAGVDGLPGEVEDDELLVCREETEARRQAFHPTLMVLPLHPRADELTKRRPIDPAP